MPTPTHSFYQFVKGYNIQNSYRPQNTHLCWEDDTYGIYFVRADNNKILEKTTDFGATTSTVETRTGANISRGWHDKINHIIYLSDSDFDGGTSYVWSIDLSSDSVTEIKTMIADIFDIWRYLDETYLLYFASLGYDLENDIIAPDGDAAPNEWGEIPGGAQWSTINEGDPENEADYIISADDGEESAFTMATIDMSGYDSLGLIDQIYEIQVWFNGLAIGASATVEGNKDGTGAQRDVDPEGTWKYVSWTGLTLNQADLDDFEIKFISQVDLFGQIYIYSIYVKVFFYGDFSNASVVVENIDTAETWSNDMGAMAGRQWDISQITIVGTDFHFLFQWSNESAKIYRFQTGDNSFDMLKDTGGELPPIQQRAIAYDDQNILYFVLGA